jgi:hypothetical protein
MRDADLIWQRGGCARSLGVALLVAVAMMIARALLDVRQRYRSADAAPSESKTVKVRPIPTLLVGIVGGLVVGMTSVGSGSLIIVALLMLYPALKAGDLVGTDLVQAIPLVGSAAIAHILVRDFELGLTASILIGAIPAVYVGARLSAKAPDGIIRPALVFVLIASGLKLLDVSTDVLGLVLAAVALIGLPLWGAVDAAARPRWQWNATGLDRDAWIRRQALLAPVGVGFCLAVAYFAKTRPALVSTVDAPPAAVSEAVPA